MCRHTNTLLVGLARQLVEVVADAAEFAQEVVIQAARMWKFSALIFQVCDDNRAHKLVDSQAAGAAVAIDVGIFTVAETGAHKAGQGCLGIG